MTFPKPFPGNCSSSYSHFTRDFAVTTGGMRSRAQALRVPVDKSVMIAHHPLCFHHSFQLPVCRSLNYRMWPRLKINVRVTKMQTNGVFLRSLSNYEEEGLKKVRIQKRFKKLWKVSIHILAWTLSTPFLTWCANELNHNFKVIENCWSLLCMKNEIYIYKKIFILMNDRNLLKVDIS